MNVFEIMYNLLVLFDVSLFSIVISMIFDSINPVAWPV